MPKTKENQIIAKAPNGQPVSLCSAMYLHKHNRTLNEEEIKYSHQTATTIP